MKVLITSSACYFPQHYSGANASIEQLCKSLMARGHEVSVLAALGSGGWFAFVARIKCQVYRLFTGQKITKDRSRGYFVWRTWFPWEVIDHIVNIEKPDVIIIAAGEMVRLALAAQLTGTPICMSLTDAEFAQHGGAFNELGQIPCAANSHFTSDAYKQRSKINPRVIFPLIDFEKYRTETSRENITFINPHPVKGRDIALGIAQRCPDIPFAIYRAWALSPEQESELQTQLLKLPNVSLSGPESDMINVYKKCRILLVPSLWEEAYGRVVTEAQISGIPVIASARGGLPEAVGPGGVVIDPNCSLDEWVKEVRNLWQNHEHYNNLASAALRHAERSENNLAYKINQWEELLILAAQRRNI